MTRFFLDTEFSERGAGFPIELLSIGIVADDGRCCYFENADADLESCNEWVKANVVPHLSGPRIARDLISRYIEDFVGADTPEFWGYYADYDWVVFCQIFGAMVDLPAGWPMYCRDLKQLSDDKGSPQLPEQSSTEHNALNDARWNLEAWKFLTQERP